MKTVSDYFGTLTTTSYEKLRRGDFTAVFSDYVYGNHLIFILSYWCMENIIIM